MNKISLIIPFYNGSEFIEKAIISAFGQSMPFHEIILVDDGSSDKESSVAESLAKKYQLIYIKRKNGGQGCARNVGSKIAASDYICFLDQDDTLLPEHNQILIKEIVKQPESIRGAVYANYALSEADGLIISRHTRPARLIDLDTKSIYSCIAQDMFVLPSATIIYKKAFLSIGGFDEQFRGYEDDDFFIRLFRKGYLLSYIDKEVYVWRAHKKQTSASIIMCESRLRFIRKWYYQKYDNSLNVQLIRKSIYKRFSKTIYRDFRRVEKYDDFILVRNIAKEFYGLFRKNYNIKNKIRHYFKCYVVRF